MTPAELRRAIKDAESKLADLKERERIASEAIEAPRAALRAAEEAASAAAKLRYEASVVVERLKADLLATKPPTPAMLALLAKIRSGKNCSRAPYGSGGYRCDFKGVNAAAEGLLARRLVRQQKNEGRYSGYRLVAVDANAPTESERAS